MAGAVAVGKVGEDAAGDGAVRPGLDASRSMSATGARAESDLRRASASQAGGWRSGLDGVGRRAMQTNNDKAPVTTDSGSAATPYDYGAGVINPTRVLQPGLVYEIETNDYLQFLCNYGYRAGTIKNMTVVPNGFKCSKNSRKDLISNLNYPSIAISDFKGKERRIVNRVVKNVGGVEATTYVVSVESPLGLNVEVLPDKLQFSKSVTKLSYQISFSASSSQLIGDFFGSITWSDGTHKVRSPFVVSSPFIVKTS